MRVALRWSCCARCTRPATSSGPCRRATYGRWTAEALSASNFKQLYVPPGCAHGFCVLSPTAQVEYKCTELYDPSDELGLAWDDPFLAIAWPVREPILSERDKRHRRFQELEDRFPLYASNGVGSPF